MTSGQLRIALTAAALLGIAVTPALAQRPANPETRIVILEQQVAASQATAIRLEQRLNMIEQQLQQLINQREVSGHDVTQLQSDIAKLRSDMESRLTALESRPAPQEPAETQPETKPPEDSKPQVKTPSSASTADETRVEDETETAVTDPGEEAYSEGYHLWRDGKYDQSITALRAFISGFPNHRRVSFAKNLIGRALLDKGQPRQAAEALLANYRNNPGGERAPDSLYYLGQALMQLGQPTQACKAYAELDAVYGAKIRPDLKKLESDAQAKANCS